MSLGASCGRVFFSGTGYLGHQFWSGFQVPEGIFDIHMSEIGGQGDEVSSHRLVIGWTLFQGARGEGVTKVMDAGGAAANGGDPGQFQKAPEGEIDRLAPWPAGS